MKKILVVLAAAVLVLSFAGAAFAIHAEIPAETQAIVAKGSTQITLGGEIRVRGWYYNNLSPYWTAAAPGTPQESNSKANYDTRVRLTLDAVVTPNVSGRIMLETGSGTADTWTWGNLNNKPDSLASIQEAWILYTGSGLFGFNSGLKIGHMPLKLGEGQFFDNTQFGDDAIVFFMDPTKELHIGLLTVKASEGNVGTGKNTDDMDAYVALMTYKIAKTHTLGMNYMYINRSAYNDSHHHHDSLSTHYYENSSYDALKFQNLGLHANGTVGNFGYKAEVDFQFGSVGEASDKTKFGGYAVFLAANYKFTPEFNLRGAFAYGSGDKQEEDGDTWKKNEEFQTLVGTIPHYAFVYDYRARTAARNQMLSGRSASTGNGIANTTYYNIGMDYAATKDLSFKADLFLLRANKIAEWTGDGGIRSKNIGWELDGNMTYKVAKNLTYQINAGILFAGKFYERGLSGYSYDAERYGGKKTATVLNNVLTLSF